MKTVATLLCLMILIYTGAAAQGSGYFTNNADRLFYGGLVAGGNFSAVNGDAYDGYRKIGLNIGGTVYVKLASRLLTSIELLYTQKGCRGVRIYESYYAGTMIEKYYIDLNYAELPLVFHYLLNDKWNIGIGAAYGQLINSKEDVLTDQPVYFDPNKFSFRKEEISLVLNAGLQFYKGWFISLRYQNSLATIRDVDRIPYGFGGGKQTNSLFSLRLMYLIN